MLNVNHGDSESPESFVPQPSRFDSTPKATFDELLWTYHDKGHCETGQPHAKCHVCATIRHFESLRRVLL